MTVNAQSTENTQVETKQNDKEFNFRQLESKFERLLQAEKAEKEKLYQTLTQMQRQPVQEVDDEDSEPYVDNKRLEKKFKSFEKEIDEKIDRKAEEKAYKMLENREQENWLENNPDFSQTIQMHAQKFYEKAPKLAEAILKMPDNFERKKLVYHNIKTLGLDQAERKDSSIQDKINANQRSPYYQPSGMGTPAYAPTGDFSEAGKKNAYAQLQKLKANLRLG